MYPEADERDDEHHHERELIYLIAPLDIEIGQPAIAGSFARRAARQPHKRMREAAFLAADIRFVVVRGRVVRCVINKRADGQQHRGQYHAARDNRDGALAQAQFSTEQEVD